MTSTTPMSWLPVGASWSRTMPSTTVITGWASRMIDVRTAGSRESDSEISR